MNRKYLLLKHYFFEEKTDTAFSREIGVPRSTITSRKKKVLKKLRKLIES